MDNKLAQLKEEISAMNNLKIRVDSEARSCSEPINIAQQCVTFRAGRQGCDLIRDDVDINLDRELDQLKMSQVWRIYSCYFGIDRRGILGSPGTNKSPGWGTNPASDEMQVSD